MVTTELPRLVIAAPGSGHGKTMVTTGLLAALHARGVEASGHKVGPDYIDPGYHAAATGRAGRNLDPWLVGEDLVVPLLLHGASTPRPAEVAVIEGVMGLFDGAIGRGGFASTAHVARLTSSPVVLVVDAAAASRSVGATVLGFATFDPQVRVAGVILNNVATARHEAEARDGVEMAGVPVLGAIPRRPQVVVPSRHLGLIPVAERSPEAMAAVVALAELVGGYVDLDAVLVLARTAPHLAGEPWSAAAAVAAVRRVHKRTDDELCTPEGRIRVHKGTDDELCTPEGRIRVHKGTDDELCTPAAAVRVAVAGGPAFSFLYAETVELLEAAGAEVVVVDPLRDDHLPVGTCALYVGGGFPEVHSEALAANTSLTQDVRALVASGGVVVGECAGLLWLGESLDGHRMCGVTPTTASFGDRLHLGYRDAVALGHSAIARAGERVRGHEFHRTTIAPSVTASGSPTPAWGWRGHDGARHADGVVTDRLHASYLHVHWAGNPQFATRFVDAARAALDGAGADRWVIGIGASRRASVADVVSVVERLLASIDRVPGATDVALATAYDVGGDGVIEAASQTLGLSLVRYDDATLALEQAPNPSAHTAAHRGTSSVAEAAVLASGARLTQPKSAHGLVSVALGRSRTLDSMPASSTAPHHTLVMPPATTRADLMTAPGAARG